MRESADSYEAGADGTGQYNAGSYRDARAGKPGRGKRRQRFDDETVFAKRQAHRPHLPPEEADDATDGLREGDVWSTWDQTENPIPNVPAVRAGTPASQRHGLR